MNNWFRLALVSVLGMIVSIVALNLINSYNISGNNMGVNSNQNITMGQEMMPMSNFNQGYGAYDFYPQQWGRAVMQERIPYWVKNRTHNWPFQNINMTQMPMQNNMNMNQIPMQNNMSMQGNMGQMQY